MDYLKIAIVQIVTLFILYYILYIPRLVCTLLQLPFQTNSTPSKIISAIFAIFQTYVIASVMILNNQIMNDFYGGNLHSAVLLIIAIFFAISNLISGTSNSRKQLLAQKEHSRRHPAQCRRRTPHNHPEKQHIQHSRHGRSAITGPFHCQTPRFRGTAIFRRQTEKLKRAGKH